jgi:capsular polysaccharide export protein
MPNSVLIATPELQRRAQDVEACLKAAESTAGRDGNADLVACWGPKVEEGQAARLAQRGRLVRFYPAAFGIGRLDVADWPLGYRLEGAPSKLLAGRKGGARRAEAVAEKLAALKRLPGFAAVASEIRFPEPGAVAAMIESSVWLDPYDRKRIEIEAAIDYAAELIGYFSRDPLPSVGLNITVGKRRHVKDFLDSPAGPVTHHTRPDAAVAEAKSRGARVVVWASKRTEKAERLCAEHGVPLARMEDGFLRSVGLGAAFVKSLSLVVDERGIYYDPSRPSDLEHILETAEIGPDLVERGRKLREAVVAANLTKYNVGRHGGARIVPAGRFGVLVPGQVEDDASILLGGAAVKTNLGLLRAARERHPDAFLIYKPHPDVEAGYRTGKIDDAEALTIADAVVRDRAIVSLFAEVKAIETMTSLAGFEALLRNLQVTTHGQPFYSGWGLTTDLAPLARRTRRRTLDELVAAALILYPRYVDPISRLPCGPEVVLRRLAAEAAAIQAGEGAIRSRLKHGAALVRHRILGGLLRLLP